MIKLTLRGTAPRIGKIDYKERPLCGPAGRAMRVPPETAAQVGFPTQSAASFRSSFENDSISITYSCHAGFVPGFPRSSNCQRCFFAFL